MSLALNDVEGQSSKRGFLVAGLHVEAGLVHGLDYLVEGDFVAFGLVHSYAAGVDGFYRSHGVALDAGDLDEASDGVAGHSQVVLHGDFGGVLDFAVSGVECGGEASGGH